MLKITDLGLRGQWSEKKYGIGIDEQPKSIDRFLVPLAEEAHLDIDKPRSGTPLNWYDYMALRTAWVNLEADRRAVLAKHAGLNNSGNFLFPPSFRDLSYAHWSEDHDLGFDLGLHDLIDSVVDLDPQESAACLIGFANRVLNYISNTKLRNPPKRRVSEWSSDVIIFSDEGDDARSLLSSLKYRGHFPVRVRNPHVVFRGNVPTVLKGVDTAVVHEYRATFSTSGIRFLYSDEGTFNRREFLSGDFFTLAEAISRGLVNYDIYWASHDIPTHLYGENQVLDGGREVIHYQPQHLFTSFLDRRTLRVDSSRGMLALGRAGYEGRDMCIMDPRRPAMDGVRLISNPDISLDPERLSDFRWDEDVIQEAIGDKEDVFGDRNYRRMLQEHHDRLRALGDYREAAEVLSHITTGYQIVWGNGSGGYLSVLSQLAKNGFPTSELGQAADALSERFRQNGPYMRTERNAGSAGFSAIKTIVEEEGIRCYDALVKAIDKACNVLRDKYGIKPLWVEAANPA